MADLGSWFRFAPRSRTPVTPRSPVSSDRFSVHDAEEQRRPGPIHMSSYPSLATHASSLSLEPQEPSSADLVVNNEDKVRYNPSLDQMVEALQVSIMTNGNLAQLPVHLNSYVLRLIEGFSNCREQLTARNAACEEAKRMQEDTFDDFSALAAEFRHREGQYKSEIRRLEVLLAQKTGLETVTLARTNSVLDRRQPYAENFLSRLQKRRSEARARDAESRAVASQPAVSFLHGHSLSTDAEVMRVLDQGRRVEGIDDSDDKRRPSSRSIPNILNTESDVKISEKFRRMDAARAESPRRKPRFRAKNAALGPGNTNSKYLRTMSTEQSQLGTGRLTSAGSPEPSKHNTEAIETRGTVSEKTSARLDGNDSDDSSTSERADPKNKARISVSRQNGGATSGTKSDRRCNVARENRFSFAEGDDAFTTGAAEKATLQPKGDRSSAEKDGVSATARTYEQVRQSQATPTPDPRSSPFSARRRTTSLRSQGSSVPRQPRPHLDGRPLTWSRSPKPPTSTPTRTAEDVFAGIRSHDSTGSINTVIRASSSRSGQSVGSLSLAESSELGKGSPNPQQRKQRRTQGRSSAHIAASLAVARDKSRQTSLAWS
ncbi:hypothetical protein PG985_000574 [Apiospora marii]|uniref:Uncharacterized protein n=1 Tax=Apiospora marii TaxID=335849 RepID=A0ABR1R2D8_9PEZI